MSFKAILSVKSGVINPSDAEFYGLIGGNFDADDNNIWAETPYGTWMTPRSNVDWVLFCAEDMELNKDQLPAVLLVN